MIEILCRQGRDEQWVGVEVSGHARLAAKGADVLCAAVSALAENLEASLRLLLEIDCMAEKRDGYHRIEIRQQDATEYTQLLFSSAILGFHVLDQNYPGHFQIREEQAQTENQNGT